MANANGYQALLAENGMTQNVKHFEGLFTEIAVSADGYIAVYYPYEPAYIGGALRKQDSRPEQTERMEVFHLSQINDLDIDVDGVETTSTSGGLGGAVLGAVLGGATGAVIGSAATSGKTKTSTTIDSVDLVINTKDFNNPTVRVRLFQPFPAYPTGGMREAPSVFPYRLRKYYTKGAMGSSFDKEGKRLHKEVFCRGEIPIATIEALQSTLAQMLAAQQESEFAAAAVPQTIVQQTSAADELLKFKQLLDSGVITQEEFDAKKTQLIG